MKIKKVIIIIIIIIIIIQDVNTFKSALHSYDQTNFIYKDRRNNNDDVCNKIVVTFCCYPDNNKENVNLNSDDTISI